LLDITGCGRIVQANEGNELPLPEISACDPTAPDLIRAWVGGGERLDATEVACERADDRTRPTDRQGPEPALRPLP